MVDVNKAWWIEQRCQKTVEKLKSHQFDALYVPAKEAAADEILKYVSPSTKIGAGGSVTIRAIGILDRLRAQGNIVYDHWMPGLSKEESLTIRKAQLTSDLFLGSSNAVTLNGELVNIDGIGNRVSAMSFGPEKVILVAGYNKIVENVEEALRRVRHEAAPPNSKRLKMDVPCAKLGICIDCQAPNRACRIIVIHERKPQLTDVLVILVGEELGY